MATPQENQADDSVSALTIRVPMIVYHRIQDEVRRRKNAGERKLSLSDWFIEASREKLDGPANPQERPNSSVAMAPARSSPLDIPGVFLGSALEPRARRDAAYWLKKFAECREMPGDEAMRELLRLSGGVTIPRAFYKPGQERALAEWLVENALEEL